MKKFFVAALVAVIAMVASAQDIYVGGSLGVWRNGSEHETTAAILPEIGYNLSEKASIGTTIGWRHDHTTGINTNIFQIAPYYRYNFFQTSMVNIFVDGGFGIGCGKTKYDGDESDTATIWNIGVRPGVSLNVNEHCSFVAHLGFLGYEGANDAAKDAGYADQWGLNLDASAITFGFYYTF